MCNNLACNVQASNWQNFTELQRYNNKYKMKIYADIHKLSVERAKRLYLKSTQT